MQTIGDRIKQARERANLTRRQLAHQLGIRVNGIQQVSNWETGASAARIEYGLVDAPATQDNGD